MTVQQSFKIVALLNRYFKNEDDAKLVAIELENVIDSKFLDEKGRLASKEDVMNLELKMEKNMKDQTRWMLASVLTLVALILGLYAVLLFKR